MPQQSASSSAWSFLAWSTGPTISGSNALRDSISSNASSMAYRASANSSAARPRSPSIRACIAAFLCRCARNLYGLRRSLRSDIVVARSLPHLFSEGVYVLLEGAGKTAVVSRVRGVQQSDDPLPQVQIPLQLVAVCVVAQLVV